jgi:hypothetical protein
MAYGIEEIAKMQVTGPVEGGDMVAKPNEMPVGAAALLSKMSKKNTPGIFKLPMPDKQMPDFMKVAAEGVEQQTAQGDSINQMAGELLRQGINIQGMGMDEIIQIYEQTFGSPGDTDEFGVSEIDPSDWRSILKMLEAGMSWEEIEAQTGSVELDQAAALKDIRDDAKKVEAFAPEGEQLAYINKEEADILKLLGGSGEREPITGVETFGLFDDIADVHTGAKNIEDTVSYQQAQNNPKSQEAKWMQNENVQQSFNQAKQAGQQAQEQAGGKHIQTQEEIVSSLPDPIIPKKEEEKKDGEGLVDFLKNQGMNIMGMPTLDMMDMFSKGVENLEEWQVKKFLEGSVKDTGTGMGNLLYALKDEDRFKNWFKERGDIFDEAFEGEKTKEGDPVASLSDEEKFQYLVDKYTGNKQFDKTYDTKKYYEDPKNWDAKEMAQAQAEGKLDFTRDNTMIIQEGRELLQKEQGGGQPGTGVSTGPGEKITETIDETITTTPDEKAGAWNLGGTMPYTHDVATGGVEMDVPLGRRFQIGKDKKYRGTTGMDLNEAMQYATLGGYQQLEPFQEYLARRRKHLGEDEPQYFDEEGNVIYSGTV